VTTRLQKNILILSASVGGGHLRAAEAVELALGKLAPQAAVRNVDVLTMANMAFKMMMLRKGYTDRLLIMKEQSSNGEKMFDADRSGKILRVTCWNPCELEEPRERAGLHQIRAQNFVPGF
jgi:hypothetical protein